MLPEQLGPQRHKVFVSYHHADEWAVQPFIERFGHGTAAFISRGLGAGMPGGLINSQDDDYIMRRIREDYLEDSTVTIVMLGECTWARMFVDWEIQASLRPMGEAALPNGLIAFRLPTSPFSMLPERLRRNLPEPGVPGAYHPGAERYGRYCNLPTEDWRLRTYIEEAFQARNLRVDLIDNPQERLQGDLACGHACHR